MAAKRKGASSASRSRSEVKQALAGMEKGHQMLQLNLKKLRKTLGVSFTSLGHSFTQGGGSFIQGGGSFKK